MFKVDILIHGHVFTANVDWAKLQHMLSVHGKLADADLKVKAIEESIKLNGYAQLGVGDYLYHVR